MTGLSHGFCISLAPQYPQHLQQNPRCATGVARNRRHPVGASRYPPSPPVFGAPRCPPTPGAPTSSQQSSTESPSTSRFLRPCYSPDSRAATPEGGISGTLWMLYRHSPASQRIEATVPSLPYRFSGTGRCHSAVILWSSCSDESLVRPQTRPGLRSVWTTRETSLTTIFRKSVQ